MSDLNTVIMMGRLVNDPELIKTNSGYDVVRMTIANNRAKKTQDGYAEESGFFIWCAFGKTATTIARLFKKGSRIILVGHAKQNQYTNANGEKRYKIEFIASEFYFADSMKKTVHSDRESDNILV
mgnify:CR=1 FL=1